MGDKDPFVAPQTFENILLGQVGADASMSRRMRQLRRRWSDLVQWERHAKRGARGREANVGLPDETEAWIDYHVTSERTWAFVATSEGLDVVTIAIGARRLRGRVDHRRRAFAWRRGGARVHAAFRWP